MSSSDIERKMESVSKAYSKSSTRLPSSIPLDKQTKRQSPFIPDEKEKHEQAWPEIHEAVELYARDLYIQLQEITKHSCSV
ncbi:unnamed protein product [Heterosigma akashiwo]